MRLKEALRQYEAEHGPHDLLHVYMTYEFRGKERTEDIHILAMKRFLPETYALIIEADVKQFTKKETEWSTVATWGGSERSGKCLSWAIEIDSDQGRIALHTHPWLNGRRTARAAATEQEAKIKRPRKRRKKAQEIHFIGKEKT